MKNKNKKHQNKTKTQKKKKKSVGETKETRLSNLGFFFATCEAATASERKRERIEGDTQLASDSEKKTRLLFRIRKCLWFRFFLLFFSFSLPLSIFFLCIWLIYHFSCFLSNWIPFFSVISFLISLFAIDLLKPFWNAFQFRRRSCVSGFARFLTLFPTFGDRLSRKSWFFLSYLDNCMGVVDFCWVLCVVCAISSDLRSKLGFAREKRRLLKIRAIKAFVLLFFFLWSHRFLLCECGSLIERFTGVVFGRHM